MAIFHFTVKIVGRSKGKSVISASAYLNGDVMKNEETGRISYYTSKKEVVYTSLMMCENAPPEWLHVPEENIKRFQQSIRYKRADDKDAALEKFKITFQKQRLWNEVLKIEKNADAQLGRSFEFSLPKEWSRQEQIDYTTEYIQKTFVDKGMCVDWSIHDKGDGNPHVHLLVTMRPFNLDHSWGSKEVKDWDFVRDTDGNIVVDESHPDWWQDKKNPDRHGIRIPVLDKNGVQKVGARNRKQWKRVLTDATGWNNPKNCELWRSEWAGMCNRHLSIDNQIDHRSYERQGKLKIPTIHEGADARKIEEKYLTGQIRKGSWKVEENQMIKKQNALLQKVIATFGSLEMDYVVINKTTGKYLCVIEVKRTPSDVQSTRYQFQAQSYVQSNMAVTEKPFYIITNLEKLISFRYDVHKPSVHQQVLEPGLENVCDFSADDENSIVNKLALVFQRLLDDFINNRYTELTTLDNFLTCMKSTLPNSREWKSKMAMLLYEYIRGAFHAIHKPAPTITYSVSTFAGDVQQICIEANRVDFDGIFAYNAADYLPRVSLTNKLLSDLYKYGEANISGDAIADSLHEMLSESSRHDGEVATDPELANLAATMAKMINGNLSANKKICDPAAGSGSLISSAMKVFNINGNQVVANDINPKLIELLSLVFTK